MLRSFNHRNADGDILGWSDLCPRGRTLAYRFDRKTMGEQHMMADLVEPAGRQLQSGREHTRRVTQFNERPTLIEREEVSSPVTEFFGATSRLARWRLDPSSCGMV